MSSPASAASTITAARANHGSQPAAISIQIPRLADFRRADKSTLISPRVVAGAVRALDLLLTIAIGLAIAVSYIDEEHVATNPQYLSALALTGIVTVLAAELFGLYRLQALSSLMRQIPRLALAWTMAFALLVSGVFFLKLGPDFSRVWLALWFTIGGGTLIAEKVLVRVLTRRWAKQGRLYRRAVLFGSGQVTEQVIRELENDPDSDIRISGIFDERDGERTPAYLAGYPRLGGLKDLLSFGRTTRIDLVIVAVPMLAEVRLVEIVKRLSVLPAEIKLPATASQVRFSPRTYSRVGNVAMIDLYDKPITDWGTVSKSLFDKVVGGTALVLLAPLMLAVAALIKLDSRGPVLFRQKRYGFNNELIEVYKFRSMYAHKCDANAVRLVTKDDPRVTPIGRFIRRTSIDELPQLLNVLKGDLSLVGPRPHATQAKAGAELYDEVVEGYFARHKVKPGITGWAQINGWRGETDTPEKIQKRVEHDLYYIENWSVFFDLYILLRTPIALLKSENAY